MTTQTSAIYPLQYAKNQYHNLTPEALVAHSLNQGEGTLADSGALVIATGKFTGRSPKDKYVVDDASTHDRVWWGSVNNPLSEQMFAKLYTRMVAHLESAERVYVQDAFAGADPAHRLAVRLLAEKPWQALFAHNLFLRPEAKDLANFNPGFTILAAPSFEADPATDGVRSKNFTIINFSKGVILIGGSAYTGEIKKGIFTVLNYRLPQSQDLPMHCSANIGKAGDTAIFFGLSGTGKTTLSADGGRSLIGDDEHGWTAKGIFNFEGGCYAKCIDLSAEKEPQIYAAIRPGTLLENVRFMPGTNTVDFSDCTTTENTRAAYPLNFIRNAVIPSVGGHPQNIFLLTADAFGVLPPISKLTIAQAQYHFLSGYTAKVAGTEAGVIEPQATFSPCYGQAFLPLHPTTYAKLLGEKLAKHQVNVWLINTGWTGGAYGTGNRIRLQYTRAMVTAALAGELAHVHYYKEPIFGLSIPTSVPGVPSDVLLPRKTWADGVAYDHKAEELAELFRQNFTKYADFAGEATQQAGPVMQVRVAMGA